ncbi:MAG TPA: DDE-type integrase/transposase/recombinase, partial [Candidatus Fimicola cottocaccae]|nr:DDE-type integrase/transposase/recombinase [Candidatus Fimicola cottocaccae]
MKSEYGFNISPGRVYRLMKSMALSKISTVKHKYYNNTNSNKSDKNILNRNFSVNTPNTVWVSDITYIPVNSSFVYLCVVTDLFSRKFISYAISRKIDSKLVINAFLSAFNKRDKPKNLIFHSD